ncbi:MAG TPA: copper homeostasis protein CutC [Paracoccaceae bacterium]
MAEILLEVCVDSAAGLAEAVAGEADRIELCSALELGGLTPSAGLMRLAAGAGLPVYAMIRPRPGGFVFSADDLAVMEADIDAARAAGLAGAVLGASLADGRLDRAMLKRLVNRAAGLGLTLHRAFDLVPDVAEAVEAAVDLGFQRILTSGGAVQALAGIAVLERCFALAAGRIGIMPGAGITAENVGLLRARLPLREVHASCSAPLAAGGRALELGFQTAGQKQTRAGRVRALKAVLAH